MLAQPEDVASAARNLRTREDMDDRSRIVEPIGADLRVRVVRVSVVLDDQRPSVRSIGAARLAENAPLTTDADNDLAHDGFVAHTQ